MNPIDDQTVNCLNCKHLFNDYLSCKAFPDGIPANILSGEVEHNISIEGDNGFQFTPAIAYEETNIFQKFDAYTDILNYLNLHLDVNSPFITELTSVPKTDGDNVFGRFRVDGEFYEYEIDVSGGINIERFSLLRSDSLATGFLGSDLGNIAHLEEIIQDDIIREDSEVRCQKGIRCGGICLPPGKKCRIKGVPSIKKNINQSRVRLASPSGNGLATAIGVAAGVGAAGVTASLGSTVATLKSNNKTQKEIASLRQELEARNAPPPRPKPLTKTQVAKNLAAAAVEGGLPGLVVGGPVGGAIGAAGGVLMETATMAANKIRGAGSDGVGNELAASSLEAIGEISKSSIKASRNLKGKSFKEGAKEVLSQVKQEAPTAFSERTAKSISTKIKGK